MNIVLVVPLLEQLYRTLGQGEYWNDDDSKRPTASIELFEPTSSHMWSRDHKVWRGIDIGHGHIVAIDRSNFLILLNSVHDRPLEWFSGNMIMHELRVPTFVIGLAASTQ